MCNFGISKMQVRKTCLGAIESDRDCNGVLMPQLFALTGAASLRCQLAGDKNKPLYITLYGVREAAEIGEQLYQQLHPMLSSKGVRLVVR